MNYQFSGRNQSPKVFKIKQAFQLILLLAVCIWLLYQIKHSHNKTKDHAVSIQSKLSQEYEAVILSDSEDEHVVGEGEKKEDGGGGDDELDINAEQKAEEVLHKESEYVLRNVTTHEEKEDEAVGVNKILSKEESSRKKHEISHESMSYHDEQGDEKDPETQVSTDKQGEKDPEAQGNHNERGDDKDSETQVIGDEQVVDKDLGKQVEGPQNNEELRTKVQIQDRDETMDSNKVNDEERGLYESEEKIGMQPSENAFVLGQINMVDEVHGFQDENGVPPRW